MNFAYDDGPKIYKWNATANTYDDIVTTNLTGLKTSKTLFTSQDQNKVLLFTQQANGSPYDLVAKFYVFTSGIWVPIPITFASTTSGAATPYVSADF